ncbi:hypothetical protein GW7_20817 [Heterocephalus glaber]|uniref:Uncharacterized protein n=1 Tax=Heterocephalus glaber TaxID=10181 RepID=G5AX10_HETGA|nr:hypothetical protein GW7_20817 [Heterocephalus glaber]
MRRRRREGEGEEGEEEEEEEEENEEEETIIHFALIINRTYVWTPGPWSSTNPRTRSKSSCLPVDHRKCYNKEYPSKLEVEDEE